MVLDASAAIEYLIDAGEVGRWVRARVRRETELGAPDVIDLEVLATLRNLLLRRELTKPSAELALRNFRSLRLIRFGAFPLMERVWSLRSTLTPYDAAYVVLAEALDGVLVTTDQRLARSRGHRARVVAFPA
jgi:predicted nucleic acid-binding protein